VRLGWVQGRTPSYAPTPARVWKWPSKYLCSLAGSRQQAAPPSGRTPCGEMDSGFALARARNDDGSSLTQPAGQNTSSIPLHKYIPLPRISDLWHKPLIPALQKGRFAIVTRCGLGCGGRGSAGADCGMTGRATVSPYATRHDTAQSQRVRRLPGVSTRKPWVLRRSRPRTEKSCGPDARGLCVKPCGDVAARPGARISHPQRDGGNSASLPGESTKDTVKTIRAGKAGRAASPVIHPVCILPAHGSRVPAGARLPCALWLPSGGVTTEQLGQNLPRE
jgi:hypothetical protein